MRIPLYVLRTINDYYEEEVVGVTTSLPKADRWVDEDKLRNSFVELLCDHTYNTIDGLPDVEAHC